MAREHILAVLSEGLEAAQSSERERRAAVLEDVLAANKPGAELERRRRELKQIIKDTGSFVDARTIAALEKLGFKCVSGNKHWKLDYANVRIPISRKPRPTAVAHRTHSPVAVGDQVARRAKRGAFAERKSQEAEQRT